jgi:hypothetical protein
MTRPVITAAGVRVLSAVSAALFIERSTAITVTASKATSVVMMLDGDKGSNVYICTPTQYAFNLWAFCGLVA